MSGRGALLARAAAGLWLAAACAAAQPRVLWRDPGDVAKLDFGGSVGAPVHPPQPPFTFVREDTSGTQPKLFATDAAGATWNVKFGYEVKDESFCWRIVRACGYFAEPSFFVHEGELRGYRPLSRATGSIRPDGHFTDGRFQFRDPGVHFVDHRNWRWDRPPFAGTKELSGLKILIMLFSNWDNKDARVGAGGPNTAVFERKNPPELIYAFTDWGAGMGRWGSAEERSNWRCDAFTQQSANFVRRAGRMLVFAWHGNIDEGFRTGIPASHAAWLLRYLGRISDDQLRAALKAAGGSEAETNCFAAALRSRIEQLRNASRLNHRSLAVAAR